MRTESSTSENSPTVLIAEVTPQSPWRVTSVETLPGFRLRVVFADGLQGTVDMSRLVKSPNAGVFAVLADPSQFEQVKLDCGAVTWPGELDLAPDAMYAEIREHKEWSL